MHRGLSIDIKAQIRGLLTNTDLVQSFEVTDADVDEPRESLIAYVQSSFVATGEEMTVYLRRLFVHPAAACRPT